VFLFSRDSFGHYLRPFDFFVVGFARVARCLGGDSSFLAISFVLSFYLSLFRLFGFLDLRDSRFSLDGDTFIWNCSFGLLFRRVRLVKFAPPAFACLFTVIHGFVFGVDSGFCLDQGGRVFP
jgi:hypothetical protein